MKRLRIAVVGAGHLGRIHARLLRTIDEVQLVGVVDPVAESRESVAADAETEAFADVDSILGNVDAAVLAAPTSQHFAIGKKLLESKIHLLIEKPLAHTAEQARDLVSLAKQHRRVLQVGHVERFNPAWNAVRNSLGRVLHVEAKREGRHTFRSTDIGVVLDLMIHDIDLVLSIIPSPLVDVRAFGFSALGEQEDTASAWLTFANGSQAQLTASRVAFGQQRIMRVNTDQMWAEIDFASNSARIVRAGGDLEHRSQTLAHLTPVERKHLQSELFSTMLAGETLSVESGNAILDEQHDFVISIRSKRSPIVTGEAGTMALEVAERVLAAMRTHTWDSHSPDGTDERPALPIRKPLPPHSRRRRAG